MVPVRNQVWNDVPLKCVKDMIGKFTDTVSNEVWMTISQDTWRRVTQIQNQVNYRIEELHGIS